VEITRTGAGAVVINDAYNANPASMAAGLRALAALPAAERVAVLGPMAELGDRSRTEHLAIARMASDLGIRVIAVGTTEYGPDPAVDDDDVMARLGAAGSGTAILVKASRVAALERLVAQLER
jgi:UDP-N-acetylmuramoyl-tripeptide--D-alanyl-D-alanine ligase